MKRSATLALVCSLVLVAAASALAVRPAAWVHNTEAEFDAGTFDGAVATSLGEIRLAQEITVLAGSESAPAVVSCVARTGGKLFAGAGDRAYVYRLEKGKLVKHAELPAAMIACMAPAGKDGSLLVGTGGGEKPGLWRLDAKGKAAPLWTDAKVKYVWAIAPAPNGGQYVATGPEGKVFAVDSRGRARLIYEAGKLAKNVLCLAAGPGNKLYAGTGDKGLILEIDVRARSGRVLYDPAEKEVAALVVAEDGSLLAATSDASKASAEGKRTPATNSAGKAERPSTSPATKAAPKRGGSAVKPAKPEAEKPKPEAKPEAGDRPKTEDKAPSPERKPKATKPAGALDPDDFHFMQPVEVSSARAGESDQAAGAAPAMPDLPASELDALAAALPAPHAAPVVRTALALPSGVRVIRVPARPSSSTSSAKPSPMPSAKGNAVYRIGADGLVETVFRRPVTILAMAAADDRLILATGNGGGIYSLTPDGDEVALVADTDAKQVTCLDVADDGEIVFGTANKGSLAALGGAFARKGTYVSKALDAKQIAQWGTMQVAGNVPAGTKVTISTRSGNVSEPDDKTWSSWSKEVTLDSGYLPVGAPAGRLIQYRLTLSTSKPDLSPSVSGVQIIHQVGNLAPTLAGVSVQASEKGPKGQEPAGSPRAYRHVEIKAGDRNGDKLRFEIAFRELGDEGWVVITDKHPVTKFIWDTRAVGDGTYELRVTASDDPSNPAGQALASARISEPVVVDNTAPVVKVTAKVVRSKIVVTGQVEDATSRIAQIQYSINSQNDWNAVSPADGICDADAEKFTFEVHDADAGPCRLAVRVADMYGNIGYGSAKVNVGK